MMGYSCLFFLNFLAHACWLPLCVCSRILGQWQMFQKGIHFVFLNGWLYGNILGSLVLIPDPTSLHLEIIFQVFLDLYVIQWIVYTVFCVVLEFELRAYTLSHSTSVFFVMGLFKIGSPKLFAQDWLQTSILLISASWVARITVVSHWHLAVQLPF
jgi:hypothetical protein